MNIKIVPTAAFDPTHDVGGKNVWLNTWDEGSVSLFADHVIHACSKAKVEDAFSCPDDEPKNCPNSCGVSFYPRAYRATRELYGLS